jgi:hypothetical protein
MLVAIVALMLVAAVTLVRDPSSPGGDDRAQPGAAPFPAASRTPARSASPTPTPSRTPPSPTPTNPAAGGAAALPDGYRWHRDPSGFSLAIPVGWRVSRRQHYVYVREPNSNRFLLIDQTNQPKFDAVGDWTRQEAARRDEIRDYRKIRIVEVKYFLEAADWEFTHTGADGTPLRVVSRGFVTSRTQAYGLYWSTPVAQWQESRRFFDTFTTTFQPRK